MCFDVVNEMDWTAWFVLLCALAGLLVKRLEIADNVSEPQV